MKTISRLQYITNGQSDKEIFEEVESAINAGVDWIQLRIKNSNFDFFSIAKKTKKLCDGKAIFIINDRVDIAKDLNADGVHIGKEDMSVTEARKIIGNKIIGGTANTLVDCKNLELEGVDYIGLGPYRETTTKKKLSPILGLNGYKEILPKEKSYGWVTLTLNTPVIAIGGLELDDVTSLKTETNIHGIAVSGLIARSTNKNELIKELKERL